MFVFFAVLAATATLVALSFVVVFWRAVLGIIAVYATLEIGWWAAYEAASALPLPEHLQNCAIVGLWFGGFLLALWLTDDRRRKGKAQPKTGQLRTRH